MAHKISEGRGKRDRPSLEDLKEERERERERGGGERFYSGSWISNTEKTEKCRSSKIARLPDVKKKFFANNKNRRFLLERIDNTSLPHQTSVVSKTGFGAICHKSSGNTVSVHW